MNLSMVVFVVFGLIVAFPTIVYEGVFSYASLWALFILLLCAMVMSLLNACIYLIFKKVPPNHKDGLIGGIVGAIIFFLLEFFFATINYFSVYESKYEKFADFVFSSFFSSLEIIPLSAGGILGIIVGYYIGGKVRSIIGSVLIGFGVINMFFYIFYTFGGH